MTLAAGSGVVGLAWLLGRGQLAEPLGAVVTAMPLVIGGLAALLAARFQRSRLVGAVALVVVVAWLLQRGDGDLAPSRMTVLLFLVPPGYAALSLAGDHPLFSRQGLSQLLPALLAGAAGFILAGNLIPPGLVRAFSPVQLGWGLVLAAMIIALFSYVFRRGVVDAAFLPALAAVALGLAQLHAGRAAVTALAAAQMVFLVAGAEEAYRLAFHDELTGLPGRRALEDALRGLRGTFAVAMVDIDHFKRFNDRYGHDAGDQVLRMVARELARAPARGRSFRYGGEEFVVLYPGLDRDRAVTATEALREAIARRRFHLRGPGRPRRKPRDPRPASSGPAVGISVSAGVAAATAKRCRPQDVLLAADAALYRAKKKGRNRVETR